MTPVDLAPVARLIAKLEAVRAGSAPRSYMARCPAHEDGAASLSISEGNDRRALVKCFAGCDYRSVLTALNLTERDLFVHDSKGRKVSTMQKDRGPGVTIAQMAAAKKLSAERLLTIGWRDAMHAGAPCVLIPYRKRDGSPGRTRKRMNLSGNNRFIWGPKGSGEICAYEIDCGARAKRHNALLIVEGETDTVAAFIGGDFPVLGIPGAEFVKVIEPMHLVNVKGIAYVREPDAGGDSLGPALQQHLTKLGYQGQLREVVLDGAKDTCALYAKDPAGFEESLRTAIKNGRRIDLQAAAAEPAASTSAPSSEEWRNGLIRDDEGNAKRCLANLMHVFARHPDWQGVIARDAFRETNVKVVAPPVREQDGTSSTGEWTEADSARTAAWFMSTVGFEPSTAHVETAVAASAEIKEVHEIRDYLNALVWDGVPRLQALFSRYFGALDTEYTRAVGSRWMISAVARTMRPGCQVDCMPVFEGEQGKGKSTGVEALFGQRFFTDSPPNIGDKDAYQGLRGKQCIEFGELDALKGREASKVKNFVSARSDNYRPSYGRRNRDFARQCVFCGTTNERHYLIDATGNRRFWPVHCIGRVQVEAIRADRDQLWAEARVCFERGDPWHVDTPELRRLCEQAQREREVEDAWLAPIHAWLFDLTTNAVKPLLAGRGVDTHEVMTEALHLRASEMTHGATVRVGQLLRKLGLSPRRLRDAVSGDRPRLYFPDPSQSSQPSQPDQPDQREGWDGESRENKPVMPVSHPSHPHCYATHGTDDREERVYKEGAQGELRAVGGFEAGPTGTEGAPTSDCATADSTFACEELVDLALVVHQEAAQ